jgi:hypothetical protein
MSNELERVAPPALPIPNAEYSRMSSENSNNVLRLFFNRFVGLVNDIIAEDTNGGKYLHFPCGDFYSDTDQTAALINTEYLATFNSQHSAMGVSVVSDTQITVEDDGVYQFVFTGQLTSGASPAVGTVVWAKLNGTEVPYSGRQNDISSVNASTIVTLNFFQVLEAGDYIEFAWAVTQTTTFLNATAPTGVFGGIPSASVTCALVSNS